VIEKSRLARNFAAPSLHTLCGQRRLLTIGADIRTPMRISD
jgi:hypothetical protein